MLRPDAAREVESVVVRDDDQRNGTSSSDGEPRRPVEQLTRGRVVHVEAAPNRLRRARPATSRGLWHEAKRLALSWTACLRGMHFLGGAPAPAARGPAARGRVSDRAQGRGRLEGRRSRARVGRGGGQEPAAALRGRPRRPEPSADDGSLADRTARAGEGRLPWLVLRGEALEGVLWNGPVLTLETRNLHRLGQDVLADDFDLEAAVARVFGAGDRWLEALQDQRSVAGIGNMWMAEALWSVRTSPWQRVRDVEDGARDALAAAADARRARRRTARAAGLSPRRAAVPSLRHARSFPRPGRREPHRLLVPRLSGRRRAAGE